MREPPAIVIEISKDGSTWKLRIGEALEVRGLSSERMGVTLILEWLLRVYEKSCHDRARHDALQSALIEKLGSFGVTPPEEEQTEKDEERG